MEEIHPFAFEKLKGFKPSQFVPLRAKCVCTASASLLPQRSLGCESLSLKVPGPRGHEVFERPCGGKRGEGHFLIQPAIFTRNHMIFTL